MRNFTFDKYNNLTPYSVIDTTLEEIELELVYSFDENSIRLQLFEMLKIYLLDLSNLLDRQPFEVLIDGSFTSRKINPNDIDIVVIIDSKIVKAIDVTGFRCNLSQKKLVNYSGVHAFVIEKFEENNTKFILFQADFLHWLSFFSKDRKGNKKGILKIIF